MKDIIKKARMKFLKQEQLMYRRMQILFNLPNSLSLSIIQFNLR